MVTGPPTGSRSASPGEAGSAYVERLTGDIFRIRSCATTSRSRSFVTLRRNSATSPGCSTSSCSAASMTASMQLLQEHRAGIPGATAALTPVPMTSSSSCGCFRMRLFRNFLLETTEGENRSHHGEYRHLEERQRPGTRAKCAGDTATHTLRSCTAPEDEACAVPFCLSLARALPSTPSDLGTGASCSS